VKVKYSKEKLITLLVTMSLLLGCSHNSPAPVFDISSKSSAKTFSHQASTNSLKPSFYTVKAGDTLFSIAWYYSVDYTELAKINHLKNNLIYPGQKLSLVKKPQKKFFDAESLLMAINQEVLNKTIVTNKSSPLKNQDNSRNTTSNNKLSSSKLSPTSNKSAVASVQTKSKRVIKDKPLKWIWPTNGKILTRFSTKSNASRGLDIDAVLGQPVRATAPGRVVYEGSGLRGYGNLVIIKHSQNYLSAYAHNDKIHVSENEIVKSGQRIADVGNSGAQRSKLHFEIRYKGKPVDPLNYLPEKSFK